MDLWPLLAAFLDQCFQSLLVPLALWILISGLDDLFVDCICLCSWLARKSFDTAADREAQWRQVLAAPLNRIAILVPCWKEQDVIQQMVEQNIARIQYPSYHFFLGVYPNDGPTLAAARSLETRFFNVHVALCQHPGPTSKADCLNWIYRRILEWERQRGEKFQILVIHDAEDVIDEQSLHWINYYAEIYDMVQMPVLPLPTPLGMWVHGVYCDEFAEFQTKDMPGRQILGGFLPSSGVGTGYSRRALERLAAMQGHIFDPTCFTEDYDIGLTLHQIRLRQTFVPLRRAGSRFVATREYFPQTLKAAIRQRTRWILGIALQSWQKHGWRGNVATLYWLWRDRKGLVGNPVSFLTTLLFAYGALKWVFRRSNPEWWGLQWPSFSPVTVWLLGLTASFQLVHLSVRMWCSAGVYGWRFALGVPLRAVLSNYINCRATMSALGRYFYARVRGKPLAWLKTQHRYPERNCLQPKTALGETLVAGGLITRNQLEAALADKPPGMRLGEYLVKTGLINEEQLYRALSVHSGIPYSRVDPSRLQAKHTRLLPVHLARQGRLLPIQVCSGCLFLASPEIPSEALAAQIRRFSRLALRWLLITPSNYEAVWGNG